MTLRGITLDYSRLSILCANFPSVRVLTLSATASKSDVAQITESMNLKNPLEVMATPNRRNVFYDKGLREVEDLDFSILALLTPIVEKRAEKTVTYPLTVLYLPLKWCGVAFKYFEKHLNENTFLRRLINYLKIECLHSFMHLRQRQ